MKRKPNQNKTKQNSQKQTNKKRQGTKGYKNNPEVSALTLSETPWCDGGLSNLYLWTFHFKFSFLFMKKESARDSPVFKW